MLKNYYKKKILIDKSYLQPITIERKDTKPVIRVQTSKYSNPKAKPPKEVTEQTKIDNWERLLKSKGGNNLYGKEFKNTHIAMTKYGKTYISLNNIKNNLIDKGLINPKRLIMMSATIHSDPEQLKFIQEMKKKYPNFKNNLFESIDIPFIEKLYKTNKLLKDNGKKYKQWLLTFDDQQSSNLMKEPILKDVFFNGRHYGINLSTNQQYDKGCIPKGQKQMFSNVVIGNVGGEDVSEELLSNFSKGCGLTKHQALLKMKEYHEDAMKNNGQGHGFLNVNTQAIYGQGRLQRNYDDYYYDLPSPHTKQPQKKSI